jgi:hypothetical protein
MVLSASDGVHPQGPSPSSLQDPAIMKLVQLVYASRMPVRMPLSEILAIIEHAQRKNELMGITGVMTFSDEAFLQILEGPRGAVNQLYAKLMADPRHTDLTLLGYEAVSERRFSEWSMGFFVPRSEVETCFDPYALTLPGAINILSSSEVLMHAAVPAV